MRGTYDMVCETYSCVNVSVPTPATHLMISGRQLIRWPWKKCFCLFSLVQFVRKPEGWTLWPSRVSHPFWCPYVKSERRGVEPALLWVQLPSSVPGRHERLTWVSSTWWSYNLCPLSFWSWLWWFLFREWASRWKVSIFLFLCVTLPCKKTNKWSFLNNRKGKWEFLVQDDLMLHLKDTSKAIWVQS